MVIVQVLVSHCRGQPGLKNDSETHGYLQVTCCLQTGKPETWNIISLNAFHTRVAGLHLEGSLLPWIWKGASEKNLPAPFTSRKGWRAGDSVRNGEVCVTAAVNQRQPPHVIRTLGVIMTVHLSKVYGAEWRPKKGKSIMNFKELMAISAKVWSNLLGKQKTLLGSFQICWVIN